MLLLYILITFCIVYFLLHKKTNNYTLRKGILSPEFCNKLIEISNKYEFGNHKEVVDGKPAHEIEIYDSDNLGDPVMNKELWEISKKIYDLHLKNKNPNLPDYVFLRRYTKEERADLPVHLDQNKTTVSFLLSSRRDFEGGDLYIFDQKITNKYRYLENKSPTIRNNFVRNFKNIPIVKYDQGDMISYSGKDHLHGVIPITKGVRYSISFFFE